MSVDHTNTVPDEMLRIVVSLLPTKFAVRMTVLSRRWRYIWSSVSLNLRVDYQLCDQDSGRIDAVSSILASHPGPVDSLYIGVFHHKWKLVFILDSCSQSPALDNLEELRFVCGQTLRELPLSVMRFVGTLRVASFAGCHFSCIDEGPAILLPRLKYLVLYGVAISRMGMDCCDTPPWHISPERQSSRAPSQDNWPHVTIV